MRNMSLATVFTASLALIACSSSDDGADTSTGNDLPVSGEFHLIAPGDVDAYVADYQAQRDRVVFTLDGVVFPLSYIGEEDNALISNFNGDDLLFAGFDLDEEEPLSSIVVVEVAEDGETIERSWSGTETISVQESGDDILYSGRLKDTASDAEVDVTFVFNESLISGGNSAITVSGSDATISGGMGTGTYLQMRDMIAANPGVTRLILQESDGSSNDAINVHTGRLIRAANLATHVPADGDINSGAVDLFTAGVIRTVEPGGILGVHSWCCENGVTADQLPGNDPAHGTQLTYFREMLSDTGVDFYFFTLQAAPFDGIHPMTREQMTRYNVVTE